MPVVDLSLAICDYEHTRALADSTVRVEGATLNVQHFEYPSHIFHRALTYGEWDICEMSFAKFCWLTGHDDRRFVAIPVFPSRRFRHSAIFVRADSDLHEFAQLRGKKVGVPEWAQTAGVYVRGMLAEEHGVGLTDVEWYQGGVNRLGRTEVAELELPPGVAVRPVTKVPLRDLLAGGELDAIIAASGPVSSPSQQFRTLLRDPGPQEEEYWLRTRVFPIMHVIVLRRSLHERHPWLARNLRRAFGAAKDVSLRRLATAHVSLFPLPLLAQSVAGARAALGDDFWPYGITANAPTLTAFCRYVYEQGISGIKLDPADLFVPSSLDEFEN